MNSQTIAQDLTQALNLRNSKKRTAEDGDPNTENSAKRARTGGKEDSDIDSIPMLGSDGEKEPRKKELEDTRLLCGFLNETARSQGKILIGIGQKYKGLIGAKEYDLLKEKCKKISNQRVLWFEAFFHLTQMKERYSKSTKIQKSRMKSHRF